MTEKSVTRPTLIRNASWAIVWDEQRGHAYRTDVDVRLANGQIAEIAPGGTLQAVSGDGVLEARGFLLMPGLVDIHSHPSTEPSYRGLREDHGVPEQYMTGLHERSQAFRLDADGEEGRNRDGLRRDAGLRRHHGGGPVGAVRRLDRRDARLWPAGLRRRRLRAGPLGHVLAGRRHLGVGRGGRRQGLRAGQGHPRGARRRPLGPAQGRRLPAADRHRHRGAVPRVVRLRRGDRPSLHEPPGADGGGGARDDPPPRRHAGAMGGQHRHPEPAHHHGALHLPR